MIEKIAAFILVGFMIARLCMPLIVLFVVIHFIAKWW